MTSDHGEGLGEHGESGPRLLRLPVDAARAVSSRGARDPAPGDRLGVTARTVDVFPTVLELLGRAGARGTKLSGRSLAGALRGARAAREVPRYAESLLPLLHFGWSDLRTLREGRFKYIQAPRPELYDLASDPGETRQPGRGADGREAEAMRAALARLARGASGARTRADRRPLSRRTCSRSSGPSATSAPAAPPRARAPGADPKDKIEEFKVVNRLIREGLMSLRAKDFAGSVAKLPRS